MRYECLNQRLFRRKILIFPSSLAQFCSSFITFHNIRHWTGIFHMGEKTCSSLDCFHPSFRNVCPWKNPNFFLYIVSSQYVMFSPETQKHSLMSLLLNPSSILLPCQSPIDQTHRKTCFYLTSRKKDDTIHVKQEVFIIF